MPASAFSCAVLSVDQAGPVKLQAVRSAKSNRSLKLPALDCYDAARFPSETVSIAAVAAVDPFVFGRWGPLTNDHRLTAGLSYV